MLQLKKLYGNNRMTSSKKHHWVWKKKYNIFEKKQITHTINNRVFGLIGL